MVAPVDNKSPIQRKALDGLQFERGRSPLPPFQRDQMELIEPQDRAWCSWVSDAFWYAVDCVNAVYDKVVLFGWSLLSKIGLVNPPELPPILVGAPPFDERAANVEALFPNKSPLEQTEKLREVALQWTQDSKEERVTLIQRLIGESSQELQQALVAHITPYFPGNEINSRNLGTYLVELNGEQFDSFLMKFAEFNVEANVMELQWNGGGDQAHFKALKLLIEMELFERLDRIDINWMDEQFESAKGRLSELEKKALFQGYKSYFFSHQDKMSTEVCANPSLIRGCFSDDITDDELGAYMFTYGEAGKEELFNQAPFREAWDAHFPTWFDKAGRQNEDIIFVLEYASYQLPGKVREIYEEILDGNTVNREALFTYNTVWTQNFVEGWIARQMDKRFDSGYIEQEIQQRLVSGWETKEAMQESEGFEGEKVEEDAYKASILEEVNREVTQTHQEELRNSLIQEGWVSSDVQSLLNKLDEEEPHEVQIVFYSTLRAYIAKVA